MRQIKIGTYVEVIVDKDNGMLIARQGTVKSLANNKYWVEIPYHIPLIPFNKEEIKPANRVGIM